MEYEAVLIVVNEECVGVAVEVGVEIATQGYTHVYRYHSGMLVATKEELPEYEDYQDYPMVGAFPRISEWLVSLGLTYHDTERMRFRIVGSYTIER